MDDFKVPFTTVTGVRNHPNADRLDIVKVYDWEVVTRKGAYATGDRAFYVPPNSILPKDLEVKLFPPESKITLDNGRVKAIKIRGFVSLGMLIHPSEVGLAPVLERDYAADLGISKYETPAPGPATGGNRTRARTGENPNFLRYGGLNNFKWHPNVFDGEDVVVTEKIHGTNFRAGWVPRAKYTIWQKIRGFLHTLTGTEDPNRWQFVYGSNNVQLPDDPDKGNVYLEAVQQYRLRDVIPRGVVVYGEIYGAGIQKGYDYGLNYSRELALFDAQRDGNWLTHDAFWALADQIQVPVAPVLYRGPFDRDVIEKLLYGPSLVCGAQKVREGVVIKNQRNYSSGRKALKWISPEYSLREASGETSDFH